MFLLFVTIYITLHVVVTAQNKLQTCVNICFEENPLIACQQTTEENFPIVTKKYETETIKNCDANEYCNLEDISKEVIISEETTTFFPKTTTIHVSTTTEEYETSEDLTTTSTSASTSTSATLKLLPSTKRTTSNKPVTTTTKPNLTTKKLFKITSKPTKIANKSIITSIKPVRITTKPTNIKSKSTTNEKLQKITTEATKAKQTISPTIPCMQSRETAETTLKSTTKNTYDPCKPIKFSEPPPCQTSTTTTKNQQNVFFYLNTRNTKSYLLDLNEVSTVDGGLYMNGEKFIILIHGLYLDQNITNILLPELLKKGNFNVIEVDYSKLIILNKHQISIVAKNLGLLINHLVITGKTTYKNMHFIGHGIGAHISGQVSKYIPNTEKLGHITGLDPSADGNISLSSIKVLTKKDATFVDVIHTNYDIQKLISIGHADFFATSQPACNRFDTHCQHEIVLNYYAESINTKRGFWSNPCLGIVCLKQKQYAEMGFNVCKKASGNYFFKTNKKFPYAKGDIRTQKI